MRIAQIILAGASQYERKSQRADLAALSAQGEEVTVLEIEEVSRAATADVAHIYAGQELPARPFIAFPIPYVSSRGVRSRPWPWRRPAKPQLVFSPLEDDPLPEVVEDAYFSQRALFGARSSAEAPDESPKIVGSFDRASVRNSVEQTFARIRRFRTDVEWTVYDRIPSPEDLAAVDVWVDPAVEEDDFDGFVAEALVVGLPVVTTRTPINILRLEQGRTGFLVPARDPNEMTHAILTALFKAEVAQSRQNAAGQTVSKFRSRHRLRILTRIYETLGMRR